ncbi:hypothetical protein I316_00139 [Kwoniella heveanensis BCC8398]|uniref:Uncharacterized protein n=1 Tax=Kwoniella heveanensis BCC8398 TaxID=1296120 RepID=A0A1B9H3S3_9TREE|nr:hypothetical protein I316_00139 [Kwoniella heveanensis BCC8398]
MLTGKILGSALSPGQLLQTQHQSQEQAGPSRASSPGFTIFRDDHSGTDSSSCGRLIQLVDHHGDDRDEYHEEELVWYHQTVVWSRGSEVFRRYTYESENENVSKALFAWFKSGDQTASASANGKGKATSTTSLDSKTFGPLNQSRHQSWGGPRTASSSKTKSPQLERTLVVFLRTKAHVYFSSGEDIIVHLPFPIDGARPIAGGGILVQRALEKRESRRFGKDKNKGHTESVLRGMDATSLTILDDLMDLEDDNAPSLPRVYALENPFDELRMVASARVEDGFDLNSTRKSKARLASQPQQIPPSTTILHVSPDPYPFIIAYDRQSSEVVFYRKTRIPDVPDQPSHPPNPTALGPEEILRPPEPTPQPKAQAKPSRPSLHRNISSFGPGTDRRLSSVADPLDRTHRRAPRMSRGVALDTPGPTDDLQAALDPLPLVPPTTTKRRSRGLSVLSTVPSTSDGIRRASAASASFLLRDVHEEQDRMALHVVAERDLRETTMMMGLERDEVTTRSEVVLDRIWSWKSPYTRPNIFDVLLLARNGTMQILTSGGRTIPFTIDRPPRHSRASSERRIVKLVDAVGPRFTAIYEDEERARISADIRIRHQTTQQCLLSISYVLPAPDFFLLKRELLSAIHRLPAPAKTCHHTVWKTFSGVLRGLLQLHVSNPLDDSFDQLLSDAHRSSSRLTRLLATKIPPARTTAHDTSATVSETLSLDAAAPIMLALHLVAQDLRLSATRRKELSGVVRLISDMASRIGRTDWKDYWARLMPHEVSDIAPIHVYDTAILDRYESPPDILVYLARQLVTRTKPFPSPQIVSPLPSIPELGDTSPCLRTEQLTSIYTQFHPSTPGASSLTVRAATIVQLMVRSGLNADWLADTPYAFALPILEMIRICQHHPPKDWSFDLYAFTGRMDLALQSKGEDIGRDEPILPLEAVSRPTIKDLMSLGDTQDSINHRHQVALPHVRFGSDRRVQEVERIMQTTRVRVIAIQDPKGASDADIARYHQTVVNTIANRTLSIPVGQGMFEFGTRPTNVTNIWDIPLIELSVKISPTNTTLKAEIVSDSAEWPCFHNGVAAGLAISPDCQGIDSSWVVFNRPGVLNSEHGGFLLGLGLTGHLRSLTTYHAFPLLEPRHDFTSVGLLLGLACSYAGSADLTVTKVLSLHTHALLPLGSMELNASPVIQSSALTGLGLVYAGSRNLRMAEVALSEVGRREMMNVDGFAEYQEAYSFSAAMAFGLIMLGRGGESTSEVDQRMLGLLRRCMIGDTPVLDGGKTRSNVVAIDHNLTGPGATLALGFMYLKTGRKDIADMLEIPQTAFDSDQVRPDLLLLRTLSRSLIMWDNIAPTMTWIESQLPPFILAACKSNKRTATMELATELAYLNIVAGGCFAIGLKYAGTATELAHSNLMSFFGVLSKAATGQSMTYEGKIRRTAARQGLNVVTLALSMVMSGTGELSVLRRLRVSHGQEGAGVTYGTHMAMHMALGMLFLGRGHYTLGNSNLAIAALCISCFPRFLPSPGDNKAYPQAFRHLWALAAEPRCLVARDVDTLETVYLPVKLHLREGDGPTVKIRQQSLISPTLIAPFEKILSIEVDSPRYWPITYDLFKNPRDKANLVRTRTIYVKRKAGFLDYNSDPKGNRSIFVRAGSMTGIDLHYDLISPAAPPGVSAGEVEGLIKAHSGDPAWIGLAKLFNGNGNGNAKGDGRFDAFIRTVMLECLSLDKPTLLPVYSSMFAALQPPPISVPAPIVSDSAGSITERGMTMMMEELYQLAFTKFFYSDIYERSFAAQSAAAATAGGGAEKRFSLVRPNFVGSLLRTLSTDIDLIEEDTYRLKDYLLGRHEGKRSVSTTRDGRMEIAKWIWKSSLPPLALLDLLRERVRQSAIEREVLELKVRDVAENYRRRVLSAYDDNDNNHDHNNHRNSNGAAGAGDAIVPFAGGVGPWNRESIQQVISVWKE